MKELSHFKGKSAEERFSDLSREELLEQLSQDNKELAALGVRQSISNIAFGAARYGHLYEDRRTDQGGLRPTPMNFFMALVVSEPNLLTLSKNEIQKLGGVISKIAMATDVLLEKTGDFHWPDQFTRSPQSQLPQKGPNVSNS